MATMGSHIHFELVVIPDGSLISGSRVAMHPESVGRTQPTVGLFSATSGDGGVRRHPVHILPCPEVPRNTLAISSDLADELDLVVSSDLPFSLELDGFAHVPATELHLRALDERNLTDVTRDLNGHPSLGGRLFWVAEGRTSLSPTTVHAHGSPYQVAELLPRDKASTIFEITAQTRLKVRAPRARAGVDIVILADCSGSMSNEDLLDEKAGRRVQRIAALKQALRTLKGIWQRPGPILRMALLGFTTQSHVLFPRSGGLQDLDPEAHPDVFQEFLAATDELTPQPGPGTDIGQALHRGAEHLRRYGKAGNDRLFILISDGAHSEQDEDEAEADRYGKTVQFLNDPVSLMSQLRLEEDIHLYAIGIGTRANFEEWWKVRNPNQKPRPTDIPRHDLLKKIAAAGGGHCFDFSEASALRRYFDEIAAGITSTLDPQQPPKLPALSEKERNVLASHAVRSHAAAESPNLRAQRAELLHQIRSLYVKCNELSIQRSGQPLFAVGPEVDKVLLSDELVADASLGVDAWQALRPIFAPKGAAAAFPQAVAAELRNVLIPLLSAPGDSAILARLCESLRAIQSHLGTVPQTSANVASLRILGTKPLPKKIRVYCCCAAKDRDAVEHIEKHLQVQTNGKWLTWEKKLSVPVGSQPEHIHRQRLAEADIILFLITANAADDPEFVRAVKAAMQRQAAEDVVVVPIYVSWIGVTSDLSFGDLVWLPSKEEPIGNSNADRAWSHIAATLREAMSKRWPDRVPQSRLVR